MHHCVVLSERPKLLNFNVDWETIYATICISSVFVPHAYILPYTFIGSSILAPKRKQQNKF